jgi:hypothetical protein
MENVRKWNTEAAKYREMGFANAKAPGGGVAGWKAAG